MQAKTLQNPPKKAPANSPASRPLALEIGVAIGMIAFAAIARYYVQDWPNVAPVAAIALFSGFWFSRWQLAACVPLAAMVASDLVIGGYHPGLMAIVYVALTLPILGGQLLRRVSTKTAGPTGDRRWVLLALMVPCASLVGSVIHFAATNFGVWLLSGMYDPTPAGLLAAYVAAIPFFRDYQILGDLGFNAIFFGGYAAVCVAAALVTKTELATVTE